MKCYCSDLKWEAVFSGKERYQFETFSFSMMIGRLSRQFKKDPDSLGKCIEEANSFCSRYEIILENDLKKLNDSGEDSVS